MSVFAELGEGIFRRNYESLDLNIGVVIGAEAVLLVDSRENHRQADILRSELQTLTKLPVGWVVNTHFHWDHTWGNARFPEAELWGHDRCRTEMQKAPEVERQRVIDSAPEDRRQDFSEVVITPPTNTFGRDVTIDVGNRLVQLSYHGCGHTNSDIVVQADDVLFAGDLIENGAPPSFGDSYPLDWGPTLQEIELPEVIVPGHGAAVDAAFVSNQTEEIGAIAELATEGHNTGSPIGALVDRGPYPARTMQLALQRAYAQLNGEL